MKTLFAMGQKMVPEIMLKGRGKKPGTKRSASMAFIEGFNSRC